MAEESKSEDIAARIAELTATNEFVGRSIDSFTDDELQSLLKESLALIAGMFNVRHSGLSAANIRRNIRQRRDLVLELRRELPENPAPASNPNETSDLAGDPAGPTDAQDPNNRDAPAEGETDPIDVDGDTANPPQANEGENLQPSQEDLNEGNGGTPNPGGGINTPTSSRRSFPDADVSAVVLQQLEHLGLIPELQGEEMDIESIRGAREENLRIMLDERDESLTKIMDQKLVELARSQTTFLNAMEQRLVTQLAPRNPEP
jgi:hypothetical protein